MSDDRALLIERYLTGTASAEEVDRLEVLLREDPRLLRDFALALDEEVCLRAVTSTEAVRAEHRSSGRRLAPRRAGPPGATTWAPWIAAAGLVLTALLLAVFSSSTPTAPRPERSPDARPPEARREEPAPALPPEVTPRTEPAPPRRTETARPTPEPFRPPEPTPHPPGRGPEPAPPPPAPAAGDRTVAAPRPPSVLIDEVEGAAFVIEAGAKAPAQRGQPVLQTQALLLADGAARLSLSFPDGTKLSFSGISEIRGVADLERSVKGARGKRIEILQGALAADVRKQPADQPMLMITPHAQAQVLGTSFQLVVEPGDKGQTRLLVREGRVRLLRPGGKSADVAAGSEAAVAAGIDPVARPQDGSTVVLRAELALWLRADQGVLVSGPGVSQWTDRSGNGRHAVQAVAAKQPLFVRNSGGARPAVRFDGVDDFLSFPCPVTGLAGMTMFLVSSTLDERSGGINGSGNAALFWHETENFGTVLLTPSPTKVRYFFGTGQNQAVFAWTRPASIDRAWSLTTAEKTGTDAVLYVQGQEVSRQTSQKTEIAACERVGYLGRGEGDKNTNRQFQGQFEGWTYFAGDIAEVIVYARALSDAERTQVEQYLLGKYFPK